MKIVYVCPTSSLYGDNKALLNIIPILIRCGVKPLFLVSEEGDFTKELKLRGYEYLIYGIYYYNFYNGELTIRKKVHFIGEFFLSYFSYIRIKNEVKRFSPDIIHTNCSTSDLGYRLSKDLKIKHIWHIREYGLLDHNWRRYPTMNSFIKKINSKGNYSISITDDVFKFYKRPVNGVVIYDGVISKNDCMPLNEYNKNSYFLFVGRLVKTKGIFEAINNFIRYNETFDKSSRLVIAGTGDEEYTKFH